MTAKGRRDGRYVMGPAATLLSRPRPPLLFEEFALGPPVLLNRVQKGLTNREARYVLWARSEKYSYRQLAADLGRPIWAIHRLVKRAENDPSVLIDCGLFVRVQLGRNKQAERWFCRLCGDVGAGLGAMTDHAWRELFVDAYEVMRA